ncbi:MAG: TIGR03087 family PEP-CTERM/XrtA system glycosyltransferase, partial [Gammaproteobacteria bacterium]|nr:TIGR03087 family PEP-CTERM/XrtA system glycosyltransferase [Gammaproteobacteria bacterium]
MQDVLYLTHRIPYPPNKGDKVRSYHFLKYLSARYRVHLATFVDDADDWRHVETVRKLCGESYFAGLNPVTARISSLAGLIRRTPLSLFYYRDKQLQRWVSEMLNRLPVKYIVVFSSVMAQYAMRAGEARRIVDFVDVDSDKWKQYALTKPWPLSLIYKREAEQLLRYERKVAQAFDASVFVSDAEAELFRQLAPESAAKTYAIHNGVDAEYFSPRRDYANPYSAAERVLVFTGAMDYWPNVD